MQQLALAVITCLLLVGCNSRLALCDYWDPRDLIERHDYETMRLSPIIVVGKVTSVETVRKGYRASRQPNLFLDLMKVKIDVENILRGEGLGSNLVFYFFAYSPRNGGYSGPPRYEVGAGNRRIFFLTRDLGVLRSSGDVLDYTLHVASGSHRGLGLSSDLGESISEILLGLGNEFDPDAMARSILRSAPSADRFSSRLNTVALLERLVSDRRAPRIGAEACFELAEFYYGHYGCLLRVQIDVTLPGEERQRATEMLTAQTQTNASLERMLQEYPLMAFSKAPFPDSLYDICQELRMLTSDPEPTIRSLACAALRKNYPEPQRECERIERDR
jgi:hypothetical protein